MYKFWLIILLVCLCNCQEDDVCVEPTTPKLVIGIRDNTTLAKKKLDTLWVSYYINDNELKTLKFYKTDSIQIPLRTDNGISNFGFKISSRLNTDSLGMSYTPNVQYVSKACGFKKIFNNVDFQILKQTSLKRIKPNTNAIENSNETAIYLYY